MKKLSVLVLMAMLLTVVLAACGGGGPKGVVQDMVKAMEKRNADDFNKTLCSNASASLKTTSQMFEGITKIEFSDMKYEETSSSSDAATVRVTGTIKMEMEFEGEKMTDENSIDSTFTLAKEDGKWCIVSGTDF